MILVFQLSTMEKYEKYAKSLSEWWFICKYKVEQTLKCLWLVNMSTIMRMSSSKFVVSGTKYKHFDSVIIQKYKGIIVREETLLESKCVKKNTRVLSAVSL